MMRVMGRSIGISYARCATTAKADAAIGAVNRLAPSRDFADFDRNPEFAAAIAARIAGKVHESAGPGGDGERRVGPIAARPFDTNMSKARSNSLPLCGSAPWSSSVI